MTTRIDIGAGTGGETIWVDLEELLATRLLVQGNSGSGKSHLLRRLLEMSAPWVQQVVIDPEGDFVSLGEAFDHLVIEAADYDDGAIAAIAARVRGHRISVVLNLEGLEPDGQLRCAATFLGRLFDAPRDHWMPALVVVDEAQLFAPAAAGEVGEEARRASLAAMTNLMCRGRKRGLAGIIATQRLAKLAKNVAAEASNFLMGRTFLDIDMARAADLLGMERRQAEQIRDLERGRFMALGPAISRRPMLVKIGPVATGSRGNGPGLAPLPARSSEAQASLLFDNLTPEPVAPPAPRPAPTPIDELFGRQKLAAAPVSVAPQRSEAEVSAVTDAVLREMVDDAEAAARPPAVLFQDFTVRCRMKGLANQPLPLAGFTRALTLARLDLWAGDGTLEALAPALAIADRMADDLLGVFLLIAKSAQAGAPCPTDADLAALYGTESLGRVRRLLAYMETQGWIVIRQDFRKRRSITVPELGWTTAVETTVTPFSRDVA
jgi:hypothetical protein